MDKQPVTKALLAKHGFTQDESAPTGIDRWHKKEKGYQSYYAWVLFLHEKPVEIFVRRTTYDTSGALSDTKVFSSKEVTANTFEQAENTLLIKILK